MDGFDLKVAARLPLAEAAFQVLAFVTNDSLLADLYDRHRGRGYERELSFPVFVRIIRDSLMVQPSAHQTIQKAIESKSLTVAGSTVYQKLARIELGLSMAFLRETSTKLAELIPQPASTAMPACLSDMEVVVLDGKTIKHVSHRLKATREYRGAATGGKLLVALSMDGERVMAMEATADSFCNDVPLLEGLLAQLQPGTKLWLFIADRQFGGIEVPKFLSENNRHFLIRFQKNVKFAADPARPSHTGVDEHGRTFVEEWGWFGAAKNLYARRITLKRSGGDDLILATNLLDHKKFPAIDLLRAYDLRWTIERVFQQVTEVFELRHLIGSTPQGTIFQAAFCLLMYNVLAVIKSYVATGGNLKPQEVSGEILFDDVTAQMTAWNMMIDFESTLKHFSEPLSRSQLRKKLASQLEPLWTRRWRKSPKKKPTPAKKKRLPRTGSLCVQRAIDAYARRKKRNRAVASAGKHP